MSQEKPTVKPSTKPASAVSAPAKDDVLEPANTGVFYLVKGKKVDPNGFPLEPESDEDQD